MSERNTETSKRRMTPPLVPAARSRRRPLTGAALLVAITLATLLGDGRARAQAASDAEPGRLRRALALVSTGASLRLTLDRGLGQDRVGPLFGNILLGYTLPGRRLQHGFGVGFSWSGTHDGGYTTPVYALDQVVVMPSYVAHLELSPDVFGVGHLGLPVLVRGGPSAGVEVGAALAYRVTAGLGLFGGLDLNAHLALDLNVFASLELGIVVDYEVLP
jgi:hypothetical protein